MPRQGPATDDSGMTLHVHVPRYDAVGTDKVNSLVSSARRTKRQSDVEMHASRSQPQAERFAASTPPWLAVSSSPSTVPPLWPRTGMAEAASTMRGEPGSRSKPPRSSTTGFSLSFPDVSRQMEVDRRLRDLLRQLTQKPEEREARLAAMTHIEHLARSVGLHVGVYGSSRTGVVLPNSDLDLCVARTLPDANESHTGTSHSFVPVAPRKSGFANPDFVTMLKAVRRSRLLCDIVPIANARVPIIKCHYVASTMDIDISFTTDGIHTSLFLEREFRKPEFVLARSLILLVKLMLRRWALHDPKDGGLGSFVVSLMVLWYLTVVDRGHWTLPASHPHSPTVASRHHHEDHRSGCTSTAASRTRDMNEHLANERGKVATMLLGFLEYYGTLFPYRTVGIDLTQLASFEKANADGLHIVNPLAPSQNAASAATLFGASIRPRFAEAYRTLAGLSKKGVGMPTVNAIHTVFGDEDSDDVWTRWSRAEYDSFKRASQSAVAALAHEADITKVPINHQAGAFFKTVILHSPSAKPARTTQPPPARMKLSKSKQLRDRDGDLDEDRCEAPSVF